MRKAEMFDKREPHVCRIRFDFKYDVHNRKGFTLVELLIVIAIVTILAGLLLPSLSKAIFQARNVNCLNNHKQLILAHATYAGDYRGYLPNSKMNGNQLYTEWSVITSTYEYIGQGQLYGLEYIEDAKVFWCGHESDNTTDSLASMHRNRGYPGLTRADPYGEILANIWYRCSTRRSGATIIDDHSSTKIIKCEWPDNGLTMCGALDTNIHSSRPDYLHWSDMHEGRGCSLGFVEGNAVYFDYSKFMNPDMQVDQNEDRYRPDLAAQSLKRMTYLYHDKYDLLKK